MKNVLIASVFLVFATIANASTTCESEKNGEGKLVS